jgi:SAM-dependent methyltransferase
MTTLDTRPDPTRAATEAFGDRMLGVINEACTALMISIGHRTGLLDALAEVGPLTSVQLAGHSGLHERYVREWLHAMTVSRIVEHDRVERTYRLPAAHAAWLTHAAGPDNLARVAMFVPLLAQVEDGIVRCFSEGGGLSYDHYPQFHALMAEDSAAVFDGALVDGILPLVEGAHGRLVRGVDVADVGCGSGHAINLLARSYPASSFVGYDFSAEAVERGRAEAAAWGLTNARFEVLDVATLDEPERFDLVTAFDAIHDQAHPSAVLRAVARSLRPGGVFLMVDIKAASDVADNLELPMAPFVYTASTMHCMTVSLGLGGDGLGTAWGRELATSMLRDAGFTDIAVHEVEEDPFNLYYVCRKA